MHAIGIDIGTTTICAVAVDGDTGKVVYSDTAANRSWLEQEPFASVQDPAIIWNTVQGLLEKGLRETRGAPACIGVTGQMHGILYLDRTGQPVSPLYTWQDARGSQPAGGGGTWAQRLAGLTGCSPLATGYGAVTHYANGQLGLLPQGAEVFCTIGDYIAMKLTGAGTPRVHPSNAASMGLYSPTEGGFDAGAVRAADMDPAHFPQVADGFALAGNTPQGIPVAVAIGDNQASFLGSVREMESSILINVGTGGQISLAADSPHTASPLIEARPCTGSGDFLLVGSSLCAGSSYALLEGFFAGVVEMATGKRPGSLYAAMDRLALAHIDDTVPLEVITLFRGTRQDPSLRAGIGGIGADNFTPQHLLLGVLGGMAQEFFDLYGLMELPAERKQKQLVCSGNGVRKSPPLQQVLEKRFDMPLFIPAHKEEACYGAALFALVAAGVFPDISTAQKLIRYR